jgi:DNA-binding NarL/FixJ family response regulator
VKQGMSNKIIARNLKLSENTVRNHMRYIMDKLKVKNRVQVAALGLKNGKKKHNRP